MNSKYKREYQKAYYQAHKEKAREYHRAYNIAHKKRGDGVTGRTAVRFVPPQGISKRCLCIGDLTQAPPAKFERQLRQILKGEIGFTG